MRNHEVTTEQYLLNSQGEIAEPGWARKQVWTYGRDSIQAPRMRIKEWDYYLVMHDGKPYGDRSFAAAFTISDDGYVGLQSCSMLFPDAPSSEHTSTILNLFPMGKIHLPPSSSEGDVVYRDRKLSLAYRKKKRCRMIQGTFRDFHEGKKLEVDIQLEEPDMDTMVIATPFDRKHAFYYNQKINCMRASGYIEYDGRRYEFDPARDFGTLDWGRGVWTYDNTWYWGSGNADLDGHSFGFNIGYGFGNTAAASENVLFYDGHAHKLDDVTFNIPDNYMDKWTFTSSDGRFEMEFFPVLDRAAKLDFKVLISDQHQVFGRMSGTAILDDGTRLDISDAMCFAEKVHNRY